MPTMSLDAESATFSDLAEVNPRRVATGLRPDDHVTFIPMQDVSEGGGWTAKQCRRYRDVSFGFTPFAEGDVLFAKITPCMENGKGCHAVGLINGIGFGSTEFHVLRPKDSAVGRFVFHLSQSSSVRKMAEAFMVGSAGQQRVQTDFFDHFKLPALSPVDQKRIAEVLDTVDKAIQDTEKLVSKLQRMQQGLVHDLLTRGVYADGALRDPERQPEHFEDSSIGLIPCGWQVRRVDDLGEIQLGRQRSPGAAIGPHQTPYLRVANVYDGFIDYSDVLSMSFSAAERRVFGLRKGDILLNEGQSLELVGRSAIFDGPADTFCFQNTIVRFRCGQALHPVFARAVFKLWLDRGRFMRIAKQTTSVAHLGAGRFAALEMACPPRVEQDRIAEILLENEASLEKHMSETAKLRSLKQGLMEDLLTGRVRVSAAGAGAP